MPEVESTLQRMQLHSNLYVVQAGDTLDTIAFRYQLTAADLQVLNPGVGQVHPGMRINVRPGTQLSAQARAGAGYFPQPAVAAVNTPNPNTQTAVTVSPTSSNQIEPIANAGATVPIEQVKVIPAASWENEQQVAALDQNYPKEEIIPDTMDFKPVQSDSQLLESTQTSVSANGWMWPTPGQVAREFNPNEVGGQGVDIAGVPGQDIRAAMDGTVIYSGRDLSAGGGNLVIVRHANELMTTYSHADNLFVAEDDIVKAGDPIASLGWNEKRESVLRFEVRRDGNPLNPLDFLPQR
ncbi:MAG: peptidoglycan DD-metalloendopeptidase family protein [Gammaproteobacteria bacterium]|nr:peptidoglycan DD-metalloendopeptidase family protein [Gammaproteobacteria bacterium]